MSINIGNISKFAQAAKHEHYNDKRMTVQCYLDLKVQLRMYSILMFHKAAIRTNTTGAKIILLRMLTFTIAICSIPSSRDR